MSSVITRMVESGKLVTGFAPGTPTSATPAYVSMKNHDRLAIIIQADNAATVTGTDVTLSQATAVDGSGAKPLAFETAFRNLDSEASGLLEEFAVDADTFTTDATANKNLLYAIEISASDLDASNGFDCVSVGLGDATNTAVSALYVLYGQRYSEPSIDPTAD